jgi:hypothetical protein
MDHKSSTAIRDSKEITLKMDYSSLAADCFRFQFSIPLGLKTAIAECHA